MKKLFVIPLMIVLVVGLVLGGCAAPAPAPAPVPPAPAPAKVIEWKCIELFPAEDLCHTIQTTTVVNTINERLAGKLHIELFLPGMLVPVPEQFDALSKGVVEAAFSGGAFDAQWIPEAMVDFCLPGSWENFEQCQKFFHDYGGLDFFRESHAQHNQYLVRFLPYGHLTLMTKERINTWADLKGMKIFAEPPYGYPIRDLGGLATTFPMEELYMALKLGTLDGCVYSEPELETLNLYEVVDYVYHPSIMEVICISFAVNLDAWNSLSPELQNEIEAIVDEVNPQMHQAIVAQEAVGLKFFEEHGGTVVDLPADMAAELHRVSRDCWDEIAAESDRCAQAVQLLRNFMEGEGIE